MDLEKYLQTYGILIYKLQEELLLELQINKEHHGPLLILKLQLIQRVEIQNSQALWMSKTLMKILIQSIVF